MRAIILAAGVGGRLAPLTNSHPKPLVRLNGKSLIDHLLDLICHSGRTSPDITEVVVVGGYRFDDLSAHLSNITREFKVRLIENSRFQAGNIMSLRSAMDSLEGDVLILNADHVYSQELFDSFLRNVHSMNDLQYADNETSSINDFCNTDNEVPSMMTSRSGIFIACDTDRPHSDDDMKVKVHDDPVDSTMHGSANKISGRSIQAIGKSLPEYDAGYVGMTFITENAMGDYRNALDATVDMCGNQASVEDILGYLAWKDIRPVIMDVSGYGWMEIDTQEDLALAEALFNNSNWEKFWDRSRSESH